MLYFINIIVSSEFLLCVKYFRTNCEYSDVWLEVGAVNLGPLIIEGAVSVNDKESNTHVLQQRFLRMHDEKLKKLWFLWPESTKASGKCGCTGGCLFFGSNRNGPKFFKPNKKDFDEGINVAAFRYINLNIS